MDMNTHVNKRKPEKAPAVPGTVRAPQLKIVPRPPGLREAILVAESVEEVNNPLTLGAAFQDASKKTQRRWQYAANARIAFLNQETRRAA